jgi:hypothetical protein
MWLLDPLFFSGSMRLWFAFCFAAASAVTSSVNTPSSTSSFGNYLQQREVFLDREENLSINAAWRLTENEKKVDQLLTQLKETDLKLDPLPVEFNFVAMKPTIDKSELFALLRTFPKGALLHSHDTASQDMHIYLEASYLPDCLYSLGEEDYGALSFLPAENFVPISTVRMNWCALSSPFSSPLLPSSPSASPAPGPKALLTSTLSFMLISLSRPPPTNTMARGTTCGPSSSQSSVA